MGKSKPLFSNHHDFKMFPPFFYNDVNVMVCWLRKQIVFRITVALPVFICMALQRRFILH